MMHVTYDGKSVLMGDDAATLLMEYAAELGTRNAADVVNIEAVNIDGNSLTVAYLVNGSSELTAETTTATLEAPGSEEAVAYMRERIELLRNPPPAQPYIDDAPDTALDI